MLEQLPPFRLQYKNPSQSYKRPSTKLEKPPTKFQSALFRLQKPGHYQNYKRSSIQVTEFPTKAINVYTKVLKVHISGFKLFLRVTNVSYSAKLQKSPF